MIISVFVCFLFITICCTSLNCIGQERHKKRRALNNKPIKTITEHLIEITSHKIQCSKHTLCVTRRHTFVASWLCYWFCFMITAVHATPPHALPCWTMTSTLLLTPPPPPPPSLYLLSSKSRLRSAVPDRAQISAGCWQCVCSCLVKKLVPFH